MPRKKKPDPQWAGNPGYAPSPKGHAPVSKVEKYDWVTVDKPGRYMTIDKFLLNVDHSYQRDPSSQAKVNAMAAEFSWMAFIALGVVEREDGSLWVYEGQHRYLTVLKRADIHKVPCMVFKAADVTAEAMAFFRVNCHRSGVKMLFRFRALVAANDPVAVRVLNVVEESGYRVGNQTGKTNHVVTCVGTLMRAVKTDEPTAAVAWTLAAELFAGAPVIDRVYSGLFYLERFLQRESAGSLTDPTNRPALMRYGWERIGKSIGMMADTFGGGEKSAAEGIVRLLNKGRRTKQLPHPYLSDE